MSTQNSPNGLVCFTNCFLPQEDGSLLYKDLWIDERAGVIIDAQLSFFDRKERPALVIDLGGNILSPGFLDIQINGAYGFDFSIYPPPTSREEAQNKDVLGDEAYRAGLQMVAERIVETGVTALLPTIITQERSLYPKLLQLLETFTPNSSSGKIGAQILGWHAEGPFIQPLKRGAHTPSFLLTAPNGFADMEDVYGKANLHEGIRHDDAKDGLKATELRRTRIITLAPEVEGVMPCISELTSRNIIVSIGHSIASTSLSADAVFGGARLITHLFNAMPQLHHRDPSIIGLLGASPGVYLGAEEDEPAFSKAESSPKHVSKKNSVVDLGSEALNELETPPQTPVFNVSAEQDQPLHLQSPVNLNAGHVAVGPARKFRRPYFGMIVDGIHSHPNSVRLAYTAHKEGCILITDAMSMFDPHMSDGPHEWRDGRTLIKEGVRLYIEGTDTLAGSVVTMDICVRNFARFTGCSIGEAIKCATYNPAKCLRIEHKKGTLRPKADADLVLLDRKDGRVLGTWVMGKLVWKDKDTLLGGGASPEDDFELDKAGR